MAMYEPQENYLRLKKGDKVELLPNLPKSFRRVIPGMDYITAPTAAKVTLPLGESDAAELLEQKVDKALGYSGSLFPKEYARHYRSAVSGVA